MNEMTGVYLVKAGNGGGRRVTGTRERADKVFAKWKAYNPKTKLYVRENGEWKEAK